LNKSINASVIGLKDGTKLELQRNGYYIVRKMFLSAVDEEKWLNFMASQGYEFCSRKFSKYVFSKNNTANLYYFSVGYSLVSSSKGELCDLTAKEAEGRAADRCELICTYVTKVYYKTASTAANGKTQVSDAPVEDAASKRRHVRNRFAFNLGMFIFSLSLLCYNLMYWVRFNATNSFVKFTNGMLNDYQEKEHSLWDIVPDLRSWFGDYPCVPHISFFLCLTVVFLPFVVFYFDQYLYTKSFEKSLTKRWTGR